jgi:putative membrane protein
MKQRLTEREREELDRRVAEAEQRSGVQIVLAVVERSDVYAELPWKAFALGAAASALAVFLPEHFRPSWFPLFSMTAAVMAPLAGGAVLALLCVLLPAFARTFLDTHRAETEVLQYAQSLFLTRELFATRARTGVLLLVSLFERQAVVLPDRGLAVRLGSDARRALVQRMTMRLAAGSISEALEQGLAGIEEALPGTDSASAGGNELSDEVIEEKGV